MEPAAYQKLCIVNSSERLEMPYAFVSHHSALDALRVSGTDFARWPDQPRVLPTHGDCIAHQRSFAKLARDANIASLGIVNRPVDILVPTSALRRKGQQARMHEWRTPLPANSMLRMHNNVLVSTPEFALLQLSNVYVRRDPEDLRMIQQFLEELRELGRMGLDVTPEPKHFFAWEKDAALVCVAVLAMELAGTYRLSPVQGESARYHCKPLTSVKAIEAFTDPLRRTSDYRHSGAFVALDRLLPWVMEGSASPMETALALMLTLPAQLGGYGLTQPALNRPLDPTDPDSLRPDLLWEAIRLVVEYDSGEFHAHEGSSKIDHDIERANALRVAGYTVLQVTPGLALDAAKLDTLAAQVATLLGAKLPDMDSELRFRRSMLHRLLFFS